MICLFCEGTGRMIQHFYDYRSERGIEINPRDEETNCIACDGTGLETTPKESVEARRLVQEKVVLGDIKPDPRK